MFQQFSEDYLLGSVNIQRYRGEEPVLSSRAYQYVQAQFHGDDLVENLGDPVHVQIDEHHIPVYADSGVPRETLALPESVVEQLDVGDLPERRDVLLSAPDSGLGFMFHDG